MSAVYTSSIKKRQSLSIIEILEHIPKFRNGTEKILANASTPDFFGASDIILGYALNKKRGAPWTLLRLRLK
jgi:hypothetical protein